LLYSLDEEVLSDEVADDHGDEVALLDQAALVLEEDEVGPARLGTPLFRRRPVLGPSGTAKDFPLFSSRR